MQKQSLTTDKHRFTQIKQMFFNLCLSVFICGLLFFNANAQLNSGAQQNVNGKAGNFLIQNARIVTVSGATIENGSVLIQNGKIAQIGNFTINAAGVETINGTGLSVYPGMIDAATNMGLIEIPLGAPGTDDDAEIGDMNPNIRAIVAVNPYSAHINVTRVNGTTTVFTAPTGGIISGQGAVINLVGSTPNEMAVNPAFALVVNFPRISTFGGGFGGGFGGQQIEFGEAVRQRDRRLDDLRRMLRDAAAYAKAQDAFARDKSLPRPNTDLKLAALVPYIRGEKPVMFAADREIDIRNAVRFADEMKLRAVILGGNEAYKAADVLKQKNVPVVITGIWSLPARDDNYYDVLYANAGKLQAAGVRFCVASGDNGANARDLPYQAGMTAAFGLSKEDALKSVTIYPAQILGVADRMGSIETGKIANIVVTDGDILQPTTKVLHLFIAGRKIPLTSRHTELYEQFKDRKAAN